MSTLLPLGPDELLSTTRSVRKRLDLNRPGGARADPGVHRGGHPGAHRRQRPGLALHHRHRRGQAPQLAEWYATSFAVIYGDAEAVLARLPQDDPAYVDTTRR